MGNDLWRTPEWLYNWLDQLYGPFDIDLAASAENAKCKHYLTIADNALVKAWAQLGSNGFCNPPYSTLPPWVAKAARENANYNFKSTWVLPVWNGDKHWRLSVFQGAAAEVTQIYGRLAFLDWQGKPVTGNRGGTVIAHYNGTISGNAKLLHEDRDDLIKRFS